MSIANKLQSRPTREQTAWQFGSRVCMFDGDGNHYRHRVPEGTPRNLEQAGQ